MNGIMIFGVVVMVFAIFAMGYCFKGLVDANRELKSKNKK